MTPEPAPTVLLLGPQRFEPNLAPAVESLGIEGQIATVTAGWQEREAEDDELREHLSGRTINLKLHERGEDAFEHDPELASAHAERQERMRQLQVLYRIRLAHAIDAAREMARREESEDLIEPELSDAVAAVRALDARHLTNLAREHSEFESRWRPFERPAIARHRRRIEAALEECSALAVAGGHVAVLANRLRLFGVLDLLGSRPILAWSAGAMVMAERIVIFHDSPPHGAGHVELLDAGFGRFPGVVPLPHAKQRLKLDDALRVSLLARRFAPAACVAMDRGARLEWNGDRISAGAGTMRLTAGGGLEEMNRGGFGALPEIDTPDRGGEEIDPA